ncbi:hypothetical protein [Coleofasciculus sp. FACHB-SPT9]|uniref:hypothetical protein n=1 Tax=Cyanophyceae TaxID=3028117 RepID=UPI00168A189D|nr:hypothetical protein [Coleofasciculus sp. FACHB-SPT9]MBD1887967.1 hypothetical protein [Coleofasciculus sp. FACHB-SPT9]
MLENFTYTETIVINRDLLPTDSQNIVSLYDTTPTARENAYREAGYHVSINRYLKAFKATIDINSIKEVEIPKFNELATNLEINTALRNLEWKSPRKHLNLLLQTDGLNWKRKGIVSLLNRGDLPYYEADLMAFFTEGLAIELGEVAKIGVQIQDVTFGFLTAQDTVLIYANLVKEVKVVNTSDNLEKIAALNLKDFGLSLLEKETAAQIRSLLALSVPVVVARRDTDLTLVNGTGTEISYTSEVLDLLNAWDGLTFTCPEAGTYTFSFNVHLASSAGTVTAGDHSISIIVNSTVLVFQRILYTGSTVVSYLSGQITIFLNVGDTVRSRVGVNFSGSTALRLAAATTPTTLRIVKDK